MEINPDLIVILSALAAVSFLVNKSMNWQIRVPMIVILSYFSIIYAYISNSPMTSTNILIVRIGLLFLFGSIALQNFLWVIFLRRNKALTDLNKTSNKGVIKDE